MTAVRLGEHTPLATVNRWKSVPSFASRSMLGVFAYGCPWQPRSPQPQSSAKMKRMFGCSAAHDVGQNVATLARINPTRRSVCVCSSIGITLDILSRIRSIAEVLIAYCFPVLQVVTRRVSEGMSSRRPSLTCFDFALSRAALIVPHKSPRAAAHWLQCCHQSRPGWLPPIREKGIA